MQIKKLVLFSTLTVFTFALFAQDNTTLVKVGDTAPDFSITMGNGSVKKLSDFKGKVVWISFFATWCPPCREELPHLQKEVFDKFKNNNDFVLIILGREHTQGEMDKFKAKQGFTMPFYPDPKRKIFSLYAKQNIPRNFIVDRNGKIAVYSIGFNKKEFQSMIQKVGAM